MLVILIKFGTCTINSNLLPGWLPTFNLVLPSLCEILVIFLQLNLSEHYILKAYKH